MEPYPVDPRDPQAALARGRSFEMEMGDVEPVVLADERGEGGYLIQAHPAVVAKMEQMGVTREEIVELFRKQVLAEDRLEAVADEQAAETAERLDLPPHPGTCTCDRCNEAYGPRQNAPG